MTDSSLWHPPALGSRRLQTLVLCLLALAVGAAGCTFELTPSATALVDDPVSTRPVDARLVADTPRSVADRLPSEISAPYVDLRSDEQAVVDLAENTTPSVVYIDTASRSQDIFGRGVNVAQGSGTGFIWDADGHIVTNFHVVQGATDFRVTMHDQTRYLARFVGGSDRHDLAVLRIEAPADTLRQVTQGDSDRLQVGQNVYAIGNPFGLSATLTKGIVSALNRQIQGLTGDIIEDVIQIDAAINPGNSGGPLLDSSGRLIGINSQIKTPSGASVGLGFAVPVNTVQRVVPQLIANGEYTPALLGITVYDPRTNQVVARRFGVAGLLIRRVDPNSGAASADLRGNEHDTLGDIIVQIDGEAVPTITYLRLILDRYQPGDDVVVTIIRDGKALDVTVTLM